MSRVLVFGCGPAGLMAAHAAALNDDDVIIMSKPRKSHMRGAQYLHAPIPMASKSQPFQIDYKLEGRLQDYATKVYGPGATVQVSPEVLLGQHNAWDIREAYDWLWGTYGSYVQLFEATTASIQDALEWYAPDLAISTLPAPLLCKDKSKHSFPVQMVWATEKVMGNPIEDNTVVCSGERHHAWYRKSRINNWENTEYPHNRKPPLGEGRLHEVPKPIVTNCDCFPQIRRMGRYGQWKKGVLSHEAFFSTAKLLDAPQSVLF